MDRLVDFPDALLPQLNQLNEINISTHREKLGLPPDRINILEDIIKGTKKVDNHAALDIHLFCLKKLFPTEYCAIPNIEHPYSKSDIFEFDPPKNGQNILKHGISFNEVYSFSKNFGSLLVPCPDRNDSERIVVFSDLSIDSRNCLDAPLQSMDWTDSIYILSIVHQRRGAFRFISARTFSRKNCFKVMLQSFKGIYEDDKNEKHNFTHHCCEVLERNLFGQGRKKA